MTTGTAHNLEFISFSRVRKKIIVIFFLMRFFALTRRIKELAKRISEERYQRLGEQFPQKSSLVCHLIRLTFVVVFSMGSIVLF
jgi:hypothetical protein